MKSALIMGITGGFGYHVARELANNGWQLKALMRTPEKLQTEFNQVEVIQGDAMNRADVNQAAKGVDVIIYGISPANYRWDGVVMPMIDNVASIAEDNQLTIVFPGNVYIFDPADGPEFTEVSSAHPVSPKGLQRLEMEQRLKQATEQGARVINLRMGDYIGRGADSTWLKQMIKQTKNHYVLTTAGSIKLKHSWAYLPDAAKTIVKLLDRQTELDRYSEFNFKGFQASLNDIANAIREASGKEVLFKNFPWLIIRILTPFGQLFKALVEMRYLWNYEVNLNQEKLQRVLKGNVPSTDLVSALKSTGLL